MLHSLSILPVYMFILIIALSTSAKSAIYENTKCITCTSSLTRSVTTHHQAMMYIIFITHEQFFLYWKSDGANRKKQHTACIIHHMFSTYYVENYSLIMFLSSTFNPNVVLSFRGFYVRALDTQLDHIRFERLS